MKLPGKKRPSPTFGQRLADRRRHIVLAAFGLIAVALGGSFWRKRRSGGEPEAEPAEADTDPGSGSVTVVSASEATGKSNGSAGATPGAASDSPPAAS